ncbi:carbohydrate ABC transporter permease [Paenibacillus yanchengensis]|uniref:Carbohydrate ABC transporter permease n=1 Tax=Paenibacillus yanchengensis TaxID=2035833 RepID=A0ABW4YN84_9BACL
MMKMTLGEKIFQVFLILFISLMCVAMIYPFVHMLVVSLSTPMEAVQPGLKLYPKEISLAAYKSAFQAKEIWYGFGNTIFRTVAGTILSVVLMSMAAYALSKKYLPHRQFYTMFIVFTMFFSGGLIPMYLLIKGIGLYDTRLVYLLAPPYLFSTFSLLIMRNFFMSIPAELEESAKMDGAHDIRILFSLIIPLSMPIIATVSLWSAVAHWNAWFDGMIYVQDQSKILLQIYLRRLIIENQDAAMATMIRVTGGQGAVVEETIKAAVLMIATLPILVIYPFIQKHFAKGIMLGSVKG